MKDTTAFCEAKPLVIGMHPSYTTQEQLAATGDGFSVLLVHGEPWVGGNGDPMLFSHDHADELAVFWSYAAAQWSKGLKSTELDATIRELSMWREGICEADVAMSRPDYDGPELSCDECAKGTTCQMRKVSRMRRKAEQRTRAQQKEIGELRAKLGLFSVGDEVKVRKPGHAEHGMHGTVTKVGIRDWDGVFCQDVYAEWTWPDGSEGGRGSFGSYMICHAVDWKPWP